MHMSTHHLTKTSTLLGRNAVIPYWASLQLHKPAASGPIFVLSMMCTSHYLKGLILPISLVKLQKLSCTPKYNYWCPCLCNYLPIRTTHRIHASCKSISHNHSHHLGCCSPNYCRKCDSRYICLPDQIRCTSSSH